MRVLIVGAGKTGAYVAERLSHEHTVTVIEERPERADTVRQMLPMVTVIDGDACEPSVLERAQAADADMVAAVTGDDEDNLVVAMLAKKHFEAKRVYARVNHPSNEWLFDQEWGIDVAVSSAAILCGLIEKDTGFGDLITLLRMQADNIVIEELTIPTGATADGKKISEISFPPATQVMAVLTKDRQVLVAQGDTRLSAGDQVLLISDGQQPEDVRAAFGIPADPQPAQ